MEEGDNPTPLEQAGRFARFPARVAARASRELEAAVEEHIMGELPRLADQALAGDLPEHLARSIAEHRVIERMATELAEGGALDNVVDEALASARTAELVDRVLASDEFQRALRQIVSSPELRAALTDQGKGMAEELATDIRARSIELDDRIGAVFKRRAQPGSRIYGGVATRAVALTLDLLAIAAILAVVTGLAALVSYLFGGIHSGWLVGILLGSGSAVVVCAYLVVFWSGAGRTPGMHLMGLRVRDPADKPPSLRRAILRAVFTWLSIVVFFLGYVPVLFDARRRGLPDLVAGTEVVYRD